MESHTSLRPTAPNKPMKRTRLRRAADRPKRWASSGLETFAGLEVMEEDAGLAQ